MRYSELLEVIDNISYKPNWHVLVGHDSLKNSHGYLQLEVKNSVDSVTGNVVNWKSGKRYLSDFMCRQEIVGLVYSMIESAEIHEMREMFRYKGRSIYNPHIDPDKLVELASKEENFNFRENSMSMEEKYAEDTIDYYEANRLD
jgi:hypothetical protein